MHCLNRIKLLVSGFGIFLFLNIAFSAPQKKSTEATDKNPKVGGEYIVESLNQNDKGFFVIKFKSVVPGKYERLILESDHVHFALEVGQKIRLSAEVLSERGNTAEVSQVLLFLPHIQGVSPVWLLSRKDNLNDLRSSK
jgi:hypothetical protein